MKSSSLLLSVLLILSGLGLSSFGCAPSTANSSANGREGPIWLRKGAHPEYPSQMYLTGLGTGPSRKEAFASGLSEIVFQIKTNIDVQFETKTTQTVKTQGDESKVTRSRNATRAIQLESTFEAKGLAKLVDVYRPPGSDLFKAFVAVSKSDARSYFKDKYTAALQDALERKDDLNELSQTPDLRRIAELYNEMLEFRRQLAEYRSMLDVFNGRVDPEKQKAFEGLFSQARQLQQSIRSESALELCVTFSGDSTGKETSSLLYSDLRDWFAARGVATYGCKGTKPSGKRYALKLDLDVTFSCDAADEIASLTMCRSTAQVKLNRQGTDDVIVDASVGGEKNREASKRADEAIRLTQKHLSAELTSRLANVFGQ